MKQTLSAMDRALSYLTMRDRTEKEMRSYLKEKGYAEDDTDSVILRLKELHLLDDARFAEQFVQTRLATKPVSRFQLARKLSEKHVSQEYIEQAIEAVSDDAEFENALSIAHKFYHQFRDLEPDKKRQRVLYRLQSRGFSYEVSCRAYETVQSESEDDSCSGL